MVVIHHGTERVTYVTIETLLNQLRWDRRFDFAKVQVWFVHRGGAGDAAYVNGNNIHRIGSVFLETTHGPVPLHRIIKIEYDGKSIFTR
jgi:hypothetical protein